MSVELRPLGVKCNIQCQYCYQNPIRDAGNVLHSYDMELMKKRVKEEGGPFTLFGGEPLLVPKEDLDELWSWGLEEYGRNSIQTNGVLIDEDHIELFRKYKVCVGISVDGPGVLNDVRWHGSLEKTRESTEKTHAAIKRLSELGHPPSLIVTLHRNNATSDKLPLMYEWFRELERIGVSSARLHVLEVEDKDIQDKYQLTPAENLEAFRGFAELEKELSSLKFDVFGDMRNMLSGNDSNVTCIWGACDSYTTAAVRGVEGNGQSSNCGRTNKDGIEYTKADRPGYERYAALYYTPQEYGGCQGCRFFLMCKGQCPGTSIDHDWRNRTSDCRTWMSIYEDLEKKSLAAGETPLSLDVDRLKIEKCLVDGWQRGENIYMSQAIPAIRTGQAIPKFDSSGHGDHNDGHGDHTDGLGGLSRSVTAHGDRPHGDHTDAGGQARSESAHRDETRLGHGDQAHGDRAHGDHIDALHQVGSRVIGDQPHIGLGDALGHGDSAGHGDAHRRSGISAQGVSSHGDRPHGDIDHGDRHPISNHGDSHADRHGDHNDASMPRE